MCRSGHGSLINLPTANVSIGLVRSIAKVSNSKLFQTNCLIYPLIDYKCIAVWQINCKSVNFILFSTTTKIAWFILWLTANVSQLYRSIVKVSNSQLFNLYRLIFLVLKKYQSDLPDQLQKYERSNHLEIQKYIVCRTGHGSLTYPLTANVSEDMSDQLQKCQKSNHICFQYIRTGFQLSALSKTKNN